MSSGPTILHADLDAFYASVEQLLDPALRGRPVAVGGSARGGVVLAASYEAKASGVQGGMPGWRAAQLCPRLLFVRGHFDQYQRLADQVMDVLGDVTPAVQRISIDEAFLDVSGSVHLFGSPAVIGAALRARVRAEVGLPISIGAARTKHLAKVASQVAKPNGLVVVEPEREREFLDPLPVSLMWGVGPVTQQHLADRGIHTIGDLAREPSSSLEHLLGRAAGARLGALALNEDPRRVAPSSRARSVGAQSALGRRPATPELVRSVLGHLAERVASRMRAKGRAGRTVTVRVRFGMRAVTRSMTLGAPIAATLTLTEIAEQLVWQAIRDQDDGAAWGAGARVEVGDVERGAGAAVGVAARGDAGRGTGDDARATVVGSGRLGGDAAGPSVGEGRRLRRDQEPGAATVEISLLAISVSNLAVQHAIQLELPLQPEDPRRPGSVTGANRWALDQSMDAARTRFGKEAVGYLPATLRRGRGVPDDFRELAEKEL